MKNEFTVAIGITSAFIAASGIFIVTGIYNSETFFLVLGTIVATFSLVTLVMLIRDLKKKIGNKQVQIAEEQDKKG